MNTTQIEAAVARNREIAKTEHGLAGIKWLNHVNNNMSKLQHNYSTSHEDLEVVAAQWRGARKFLVELGWTF